MNIAFDLDDILASFQDGWCLFNNTRYGTSFTAESFTEYNYEKIMGISQEEVFRRIFELYDAGILLTLSPVHGAFEVVAKLAKQHQLSIITSRPSEVRSQSEEWLERCFPGIFSQMHLTGQISREGHNHKVTKADICLENNIDLLVEDAPIYAEQVSAVGKRVALVTKPWNSLFVANSPIVRVRDIGGVLELVDSLQIDS